MSNETDLDWLARNVHVWREGANYVCVNHTDGGHVFHEHNRNCAIWFTKDQWLARRAELQNKPTEWPKRANWLAQNGGGEWAFYSDSADNPPQNRPDGNWYSDDVEVKFCHPGEVLGDWRDTLEKRQEQNELEPFVSVEDSQEKEMKRDNGWFERGELPPVGCECEILGAFGHYQEWFPCKIIAEHSGSVFAANERSWMNVRKGERQFRPLRTERDVLIEIIKQWDGLVQTDDVLADAILAVGFSLRAK